MAEYKWPAVLGGPEEFARRWNMADSIRHQWLHLYQDAYAHCMPQREAFYTPARGEYRGGGIYDSVGQIALSKFSSRLQALFFPSKQKWMTLIPGEFFSGPERDMISRQLESITDTFFFYLNHSNFDVEINSALMDLGVGMGAMLAEHGTLDDPIRFTTVGLETIMIEEGRRGSVQGVYRDLKIHYENIRDHVRDPDLSSPDLDSARNNPRSEVMIREGTLYDPADGKHHLMHVFQNHLIGHQKYDVSPWIIFRWLTAPGEIFGRGPALMALPDLKVLNKTVELYLRNAALAISGVWTVSHPGDLNRSMISITPGALISVFSNDSKNPTIRPLEMPSNFDLAHIDIAEYRRKIEAHFFLDERDAGDAIPSATQSAIESQTSSADRSSAFARLETELMMPLVDAAVHILQNMGKMPRFRIDGKEVSLAYRSPISKAQAADEARNIQALMGAQPVNPDAFAMAVDSERMYQELGRALSVPESIIRTPEEITAHKAEILEGMRQAQAHGMAPGGQPA